MTELFHSLDLISILLSLLVFLPICVHVGYWIAKLIKGNAEYALDDTIPASILGVHALLLGFTFSMSIGRYEERRHHVVKEANAIGTAYLRSQTLPAPYDTQAQTLYKAYVENILRYGKMVYGHDDIDQVTNELATIQKQLWTQAQEITKTHRTPIESLYLVALNEVIDDHSERTESLRNRLPLTVLVLLLITLAMAMMSFGYVEGQRGRKNSFWLVTLSVLFAVVLTIIIDMDRPRRGWIQVSEKPMEELYESIAK